MNQIELIVGLKIPDTTAITTFHTLEKLNFKELKKLKRENYYKFTTDENIETFSKKIGKVDILVNANKNKYITKKVDEKIKEGKTNLTPIKILVKDLDNENNLLSTLQQRLGFKQIKSMEKGILWTLYLETNKEAAKIAEKITKKLLYNEHYQSYEVL
jgi:phosphoribosylformylglycinamidine (FGAM) synthase PurS component|tara:strand:+ start:303 stop:776 length:474 start_codon:yes stop_codon:yes gene_type:complete